MSTFPQRLSVTSAEQQSRSGCQSVMIIELSMTTSYTIVERQRNISRYFPLAVLTDAKGSATLIASKSFLPFYAT